MANVGEMANCPICGKEFLVNRPNRRYCCPACAEEAHKYKKVGGYVKICEHCGRQYTAKKADRKYCSPACNREVESIRRKEKQGNLTLPMIKSATTKINKEVDRIEILADKEDLSYGQYVAKYGL